jgi:L-aminopeptidase/D-esterase-like protein
MAQDGLARTIKPIHTPYDGDVIFAASTNTKPAGNIVQLGSVAADVVSAAVERSVMRATSIAGIPAAHAS